MRALAALLLLAACEPAPPRFIEVDAPGRTADSGGPYQIAAVVRGATDEVTVFWFTGGALAGVPFEAPLRRTEDGWRGVLDGQPAGTTVTLWLEAAGPGGTTRHPSGDDLFLDFLVIGGDDACAVDGDCPGGQVCDRLEGRCHVPPEVCADDGDCSADYICVEGECRFRPSTCENDAACGAGAACLDGVCVREDECGEGRPCDDGLRCVSGRCLPDAGPCGGECPDGERCFAAQSRCVECHADGHCPGGHCDLSRFTCVGAPRGRICVPCAPDSCGPGFECALDYASVCLPSCEANECPAGTFCDGRLCIPEQEDGFCRAWECEEDEACESGACQGGICEARQFCELGSDCAADRLCREGRCVPREPLCYEPTDCPRGRICVGGRCVESEPPAEACAPCDSALDCPNLSLCVDAGDGPQCFPLCRDACPGQAVCQPFVGGGVCLDPLEGTCAGAVACGADFYEPNDAVAEAAPLEPNRGGAEAVVCPSDSDFFELVRGRGTGYLQVATMAPILLRGFDEAGAPRSEVRVVAEGTLELRADTRYVQVVAQVEGETYYELAFTERGGGGACDDDNFEEDDDRDAATTIQGGADINSVLCPGDPDWFRLRFRRNQRIGEIRIETGGPVLWLLEDGAGRQVGEGRIAGAGVVRAVPGGDRTAHLRLVCDGCGGGVAYNLTTEFR